MRYWVELFYEVEGPCATIDANNMEDAIKEFERHPHHVQRISRHNITPSGYRVTDENEDGDSAWFDTRGRRKIG